MMTTTSTRSRTHRPPSLNLSLSSDSDRHHSRSLSTTPSPDLDLDDTEEERESSCHSFDSRNRRTFSSEQDGDTDSESTRHTHNCKNNPSFSKRSFEQRMNMSIAGPCCFKQPTLKDVLDNMAPPPYTLPAFMAYLSQNHCLETLEFIMDAERYTKHYLAAASHTHPMSNLPGDDTLQDPKDSAYVRLLWKKLLDAYIVPNGPREVNLPCNIRDHLLCIPNTRSPPPPEALKPAVDIVNDLIQESCLVPFLAECQKDAAYYPERHSSPPPQTYSPEPHHLGLDETLFSEQPPHKHRYHSLRRRRAHSPADPPSLAHSFSAPPRTTSPFSPAFGWVRDKTHPNHSSWSDADDSSPPSLWPSPATPVTPPTTPPTGELTSPKRVGERAEKGWKRMTGGIGRGLGFGRKNRDSSGGHHAHTSGQYW